MDMKMKAARRSCLGQSPNHDADVVGCTLQRVCRCCMKGEGWRVTQERKSITGAGIEHMGYSGPGQEYCQLPSMSPKKTGS